MKALSATCLCLLFLAPCSQAANEVNAQRVIEDFNFEHVDDLLRLSQMNVKMVIFKQKDEAAISSAHLELFKRWIRNGGIGYICEDAIGGSLFTKLNLAEFATHFVKKESQTLLDCKKGIGELFVKSLLPAVAIEDHPVTESVEMLYVGGPTMAFCGKNKSQVISFDPNPGVKLTPILRLGYADTEYRGSRITINHTEYTNDIVTILGVLEDGQGLIVLDGTGLMTGNNSLDGNTYDWPKMYRNLLNYNK